MSKPLTAESVADDVWAAVRLSLIRFWIKQGNPPEEANELAQAGLVKCVEKFETLVERFRGDSNFTTYLIKAGIRGGYDFLRKERRQIRTKQKLFDVVDSVNQRRQSRRRKPVVQTESDEL